MPAAVTFPLQYAVALNDSTGLGAGGGTDVGRACPAQASLTTTAANKMHQDRSPMREPDRLTDRFTICHASRKTLARRILKRSY
jgi:hypothetical protein